MPCHFRPLELCNTYYKILLKIIVNRLKPLLPNLISLFQGAYIAGRHCSDLFLLDQEKMNSMNLSKSKEG